MELVTRHFGVIDIDGKNIIEFPEGIPGFDNLHRFVLLSHQKDNSPFRWLQCIDDGGLAFVVIDPRAVFPSYSVDIDAAEVEVLKIGDTDKVVMLSIVVVPEDISKMTANFKAPILINAENNIGKQVVIESGDYAVRHYIFDELRRMGGEE